MSENSNHSILGAQKEMNHALYGGFPGQLVSGIIWLIASSVSTFINHRTGMLVLFFGCMFIFPLTKAILYLFGRPGKVSSNNGLWHLGTQVAFIVPINFLLVGAALLYKEIWFFPAAMIVVGSHYLPFATLYGTKIYTVLSAVLVMIGVGLVWFGISIFSLGGWITGFILIVCSFIIRYDVLRKEKIS